MYTRVRDMALWVPTWNRMVPMLVVMTVTPSGRSEGDACGVHSLWLEKKYIQEAIKTDNSTDQKKCLPGETKFIPAVEKHKHPLQEVL